VSAQLDIVRNSLAGWSERDMDRMVEHWDPDIVWDMSRYHPNEPGREVVKGADDFILFLGGWLASWRSQELWAEEIAERGERVLAVCNRHGVVRSTGTAVERRWAMLWTFREGVAVRVDAFSDADEARAAFRPGSG
jgi:ketosteroid isomerase-like protein